MADVQIDSDDVFIPGVNFTENGVDQPAPAEFHWILYCKSGGIYLRKHDGTIIGPLTDGSVKTMHITEVDGAPFLLPGVLEFPNGTISDQGDGVARYTPPAAPGGGDVHFIAEQTAPAGGADNITFADIPQTYRHLRLSFTARSERVASEDSLALTFNDDASSLYSYLYQNSYGSVFGSIGAQLASAMMLCPLPGSAAVANYFASGQIDIPYYRQADRYRGVRTDSTQPLSESTNGVHIGQGAGLYKATTAISKIVLVASNGQLVEGSTFSLYGIT